jgi:hypothetical protein
VFPSRAGTEMDLHNLRRQFRNVVRAAGLPSNDWTLREMRHTFVSLLSDHDVPVESIARLVGAQGWIVGDGDDLPAAATPGAGRRRRRHGPNLRAGLSQSRTDPGGRPV